MVDLDVIFSEMESRSTPDDSVLCVIDDNLRIVTVPSSGMVFGVEKDKDVNKIDFEMDRYYRDNDMSEFSARIYYQNAKGNKNYSTVTDLSFTEDKITFSWTVPAYALMYEGTIRFAVNFIKISGSVVEKAFNTTIASANCLIGLYIDTQIPEKEFEDYLTHLKNEIKGYSDVQLAAIEDAKTEALTGIDDAEEEALLNIKQASPALPVITDSDFGKAVTVKLDASGLELSGPYAPIEVAVRPTVSGNPAVAEDSIAWKLQGLKVYGKSMQDGTPSPENPMPIVSAGDGGNVEIVVNGMNLFDSSELKPGYWNNGEYESTNSPIFRTAEIEIIKSGDYTWSFGEDLRIVRNDTEMPNRDCSTFTVSYATGKHYLSFRKTDNSNWDNGVNIMFNIGSNALPWEPYISQSLTVSTPNGLPGIPVESGGNFTDVDGQQLVCNVKDYGTGKYIQNCVKTILDGSDDENWKTNIASNIMFEYIPPSSDFHKRATFGFCDSFPVVSQIFSTTTTTGCSFDSSADAIRFRPENYAELSLEQWKLFLSEHPVEILYQRANPVQTDIPAEELAAYRALQTYTGTTVVSTAEPVAGIEVSYVADTQKYIDKKIEEAISKLNAAQQGEETNVSL